MALEDLLSPEPLESRYSVGRILGEGGFAIVRFGIDNQTKRRVAIKYILKKHANDGMNLELEVRALSKLGTHPNIVSYYGLYQNDRHYMLVMEFIKGGQLLDILVSKARLKTLYSEAVIALILHQVVSAVAHCHRHHILHRDIKADNLLITSQEQLEQIDDLRNAPVKLADFGLAVELKPGEVLTDDAGTTSYMAPERVRGDPYDYKSDVFSIGVLMYILLSGKFPFYGRDREETVQSILDPAEPTYGKEFSSLSPACMSLLRDRLLNKDPSQRPSVSELLSDPWLTGEAASTHEIKGAITAVKRLNIRMKFRGCVRALVARNRMRTILSALRCESIMLELLEFNITTEDIRRLSSEFKRHAWGRISLTEDEFVEVVQTYLGLPSKDLPKRMFDTLQIDGKVNTRDFALALAMRVGLTLEDRLRMAFWLFDNDHSGSIDKLEYCDMIVSISRTLGRTPPSLAVLEMQFDEADEDGSGTLGKDEFVRLVVSNPIISTYIRSLLRLLAVRREVFQTSLMKTLETRRGWLFVRYQGILRFWNERYCALEGIKFYIYSTENTNESPLDIIALNQALLTCYTDTDNEQPLKKGVVNSMPKEGPNSAGALKTGQNSPTPTHLSVSPESPFGNRTDFGRRSLNVRPATPPPPSLWDSSPMASPRAGVNNVPFSLAVPMSDAGGARVDCPPRIRIDGATSSVILEAKTRAEIETWVRLFENVGVRVTRAPFTTGPSSPRELVRRRGDKSALTNVASAHEQIGAPVHIPPTPFEIELLARKFKKEETSRNGN